MESPHRTALLQQALALPPHERDAFLSKGCQGDDALCADLQAQILSQRLAHYEVLEKLGGGGMGVVYKARDTRLDRFVALKFLPAQFGADEAAKQRFMHEARAASSLDHANICTVHDIDETADGQLFIAMAYYEGETLKKKIARGPLAVEEAVDFVAQVARGLAQAHRQGIVHRDIKPANVMVTQQGQAKIVDFGLAKMTDVALTRTGTTLGTVAYMSPEQARGIDVDHRTDLWSLGVVLYEMLTGERPFPGDYPHAVLYNVQHRDPPPLREVTPDAPEALEHVVAMCLEKDRDLRYPAATDLLADLEMLSEDPTLAGNTLAGSTARYTRGQRTQVVWRGLAGGMLFTALMLLLLIPAVRRAVLPSGSLPAMRHLAVLPLVDAHGTDQVLADGLADKLRLHLSRLESMQEGLWVIPTQDMQRYRVVEADQARQRFAANLAVSGQFERREDHVRLTLTLMSTGTGRALRSTVVEGQPTDLPAFQESLLQQVAKMLDLEELQPQIARVLDDSRPTAPGAYDFYLRGRGELQRYQRIESIDAAIMLFGRALQEDSAFAPAYAGLGEAYRRKFWATNERHWLDEARVNADLAAHYNDNLAEVYVSLGMIHQAMGGYSTAKMMFTEALKREPTSADAHRELAKTYEALGEFAVAEATYQRAISLKPNYWVGYNYLGIFYHKRARHGEAIEQFMRVVDLAPDNQLGYNNVGTQYSTLGDPVEAAKWFHKSIAVRPDYSAYRHLGNLYYRDHRYAEAASMYERALAFRDVYNAWGPLANAYHRAGEEGKARAAWRRTVELAQAQLAINPRYTEATRYLVEAYAKLGQESEARAALETLVALTQKDAITLETIAWTYEILGERELALRYVQEALENGFIPVYVERDWWLRDLVSDPRYEVLVQPYMAKLKEPTR